MFCGMFSCDPGRGPSRGPSGPSFSCGPSACENPSRGPSRRVNPSQSGNPSQGGSACSDPNASDEWTSTIVCTHVEAAGASDPAAAAINGDLGGLPRHVAIREVEISELLLPYATSEITAFTEWRERFSEAQLWTPSVFYHAFILMEVEGEKLLCTEKYSDKLDVMFGDADVLRAFATRHHAHGVPRKSSVPQERWPLPSKVFIRDLLDWINGPLAKVWQPYNLVSSNCQHYANDLQKFLLDPSKEEDLHRDRDFVTKAVKRSGANLRFVPEELRHDREVVLEAVRKDATAMQYAAEELKRDREFVLAAAKEFGSVLAFVPEELTRDPQIVLTAVRRNGSALRFAAPELRKDRMVVLTAVRNYAFAITHASEELQRDREVLQAANHQRAAERNHMVS